MHELSKLKSEGKILNIGLSEASAKTIRFCHSIAPISCIQQEYSLGNRDLEKDIIPTCKELGIGVVA